MTKEKKNTSEDNEVSYGTADQYGKNESTTKEIKTTTSTTQIDNPMSSITEETNTDNQQQRQPDKTENDADDGFFEVGPRGKVRWEFCIDVATLDGDIEIQSIGCLKNNHARGKNDQEALSK